MMPFGTAVIYNAKESSLLMDDPCLYANFPRCFCLSSSNSILHHTEQHDIITPHLTVNFNGQQLSSMAF